MANKSTKKKSQNGNTFTDKREKLIKEIGELYLKFSSVDNEEQKQNINKKLSSAVKEAKILINEEREYLSKLTEIRENERKQKEEERKKIQEENIRNKIINDEKFIFIRSIIQFHNDKDKMTELLRDAVYKVLFKNNTLKVSVILNGINSFPEISNQVRYYILMLLGGFKKTTISQYRYEFSPKLAMIEKNQTGSWVIKQISQSRRREIIDFYNKNIVLDFEQLYNSVYRKAITIAKPPKIKPLSIGEKGEEGLCGPHGVPQDPNYNKYKMRKKRN